MTFRSRPIGNLQTICILICAGLITASTSSSLLAQQSPTTKQAKPDPTTTNSASADQEVEALAASSETNHDVEKLAELTKEIASLTSLVEAQAKELKLLRETQKELRNQIDQLLADKAERFSFGPVQKLFDGKSLNGWEITSYGGEGEIEVIDGTIQMGEGDPITGINLADGVELPKQNYEISFNAMKIEGTDFFGSLTFPVNDTFCTLVVGGWAGTLIGLSNLDGKDASENGTRVLKKFERNQWYHIRVRVLADRITAWIDGEKMVDESIAGREVSIRGDITPSRPLGITSFITVAALKDIELRKLTDMSKK